mmetsp:Transcript_29030/g.70811  ORF Transcript_29030/g.70811 Transcript_29030/m.70811 type:complete len:497 (-) Transcript_29030:104-1594(-)
MADTAPQKRIQKQRKSKKANKRCFDCRARAPQYVCLDYATFICTRCAGVHREFGSRVKSITMSSFVTADAELLEAFGNDVARKIWMGKWKGKLPALGEDSDRIRSHIRRKYQGKRWHVDSTENKALLKKAESISSVGSRGFSVQKLFDVDVDDEFHGAPATPSIGDLDLDDLFGDSSTTETKIDMNKPGTMKTRKKKLTGLPRLAELMDNPRGPTDKKGKKNGKKNADLHGRSLEFLDYLLAKGAELWAELFKLPSKGAVAVKGAATSDKRLYVLLHIASGWLSLVQFLFRTSIFGVRFALPICLVLEAMYFWLVKNVTGPRLARVRWYLKVPEDASKSKPPTRAEGRSEERRPSAKQQIGLVKSESKKAKMRPQIKSRIVQKSFFIGNCEWSWHGAACEDIHPSVRWLFWFGISSQTTLWALMLIGELLIKKKKQTFEEDVYEQGKYWSGVEWTWVALFGLLLSSINLISFTRAHSERQDRYIGEIVDVNIGASP